jgi:hypothetical protein
LETSKKRGPPKGYIEAVEKRLKRMETVLGSLVTHPALSDTVKDKNGKKRKTALDATKVSANGGWQAKIESLDELLTDVSGKLGITIDYSEHKKHDSEESDEDDEGDVTTSMVELDNGQQRYIGKSSGLPLTHTTEHATQLLLLGKEASPTAKDNVHVQVSKAPVSTHTIAQLNVPSWAYELPPANVATHFISLYFERIYPFHPIPHRALFMDRLQKPMNNPFLILLNAIYALACKFSHDEAIRDLYGEKRSAGRIFYDRAKAILNECFDESSHTTVEALIIMSQFQHGSGENMSSWLLSGMAIRMAQDLGLHRDMSKSKDSNGAENEARKRVWWACFFNDTMSSAVMGRPLSIDEKESDTQLLDESEICMVVHGVSVPVYFNAILRLFQIFRKILRAVYGLRANNLNKVQRPLDQSFMDPALSGLLDAWTLQLHEQLRTKVEDLNMESTSDPCVPRLFYICGTGASAFSFIDRRCSPTTWLHGCTTTTGETASKRLPMWHALPFNSINTSAFPVMAWQASCTASFKRVWCTSMYSPCRMVL